MITCKDFYKYSNTFASYRKVRKDKDLAIALKMIDVTFPLVLNLLNLLDGSMAATVNSRIMKFL